MSEQLPQPSEIARRNDEFRQAGPNGDWVATVGALALRDFPGLVRAVMTFDTFTTNNDPYGEHDFGAIPWHGEKTYWKIDYYDQAHQYWCDPLAPDCRRILTILLASEY
jgi:Protein of unknown function (DUF3768)